MVMGLKASGMVMSAAAVKAKILQDVNTDKGGCSSSTNGALYSNVNRKKPSVSKNGKDVTNLDISRPSVPNGNRQR